MIEYEHLIFGGDMLHEILAKLYSSMLAYSHTPTNMKRGLIVTLHKGGNKRKDDPNNHRAITLSSCILKLYERLILEKITSHSDSSRLSNLQGGFQKGMGCIMTSFLLREAYCTPRKTIVNCTYASSMYRRHSTQCGMMDYS